MDIIVQEKLSAFFSKYSQIQFKKGDIIIGSSDLITHIFYLTKGYVEQRFMTKDGEELIVHIFKPVSFFPMMTAISGKENEFDFIAIEDLVMYKAPKKDTLVFVKDNPDVLFDLSVRFAQGIDGLVKRLVALTFVDSHNKLASILYYFADNIGVEHKEGIIIPIQLTHTDLSSWLGIARETVSRHFEMLEDQGVLTYNDHRIVVKDIKKLKDEISRKNRSTRN